MPSTNVLKIAANCPIHYIECGLFNSCADNMHFLDLYRSTKTETLQVDTLIYYKETGRILTDQ